MSEEGNKQLEENLKVEMTQEKESPSKNCELTSDNISTSNVQHGVKRSLDEGFDTSKLPHELRDKFKPLQCELCNVSVSSSIVAYTHYQGKTHQKNIKAYMKKHYNVENTINVKQSAFVPLKCEICEIALTSEIVYQQHFAGKQHRKKLKLSKHDPVVPVSKSEVDPTGRFGIGEDFLPQNEQPSQSTSSVKSTFCEICTVFTDTEEQMKYHKQGQKHLKNLAKRKLVQNISVAAKEPGFYNDQDVSQATSKPEK